VFFPKIDRHSLAVSHWHPLANLTIYDNADANTNTMSTPGQILKNSYTTRTWDFSYAIERWFSLPTREDAENWPQCEDESWEVDKILDSRKPLTDDDWELLARVLITREFPADETFPLPQLLSFFKPAKNEPTEAQEEPTEEPAKERQYFVSYKLEGGNANSHRISAYSPGEALWRAFKEDGTDALDTWECLLLPHKGGDDLSYDEAKRNLCLMLLDSSSHSLSTSDWDILADALLSRKYTDDVWLRISPVESL